MLIVSRLHILKKVATPAIHSHRDRIARARRTMLAAVLDPRTAVSLGISGQLVFIMAVLAISERWLDVRTGMTATTASLGAYGCSLVLGRVAEQRIRRGR